MPASTDWLCFDVSVHAAPPPLGDPQADGGELTINAADLPPFELSFEQVAERLAKLPQMFIEPDGSFVWAIASENRRHQLDGNLYDRGDRLLYSTLKGQCTVAALQTWLAAVDWPGQAVIIQDVRAGSFHDIESFLALAQAPQG